MCVFIIQKDGPSGQGPSSSGSSNSSAVGCDEGVGPVSYIHLGQLGQLNQLGQFSTATAATAAATDKRHSAVSSELHIE